MRVEVERTCGGNIGGGKTQLLSKLQETAEDRGAWMLQSTGSQRVRYNLVTEQQYPTGSGNWERVQVHGRMVVHKRQDVASKETPLPPSPRWTLPHLVV